MVRQIVSALLKNTLPRAWVDAIRTARALPNRVTILERKLELLAESQVREVYAPLLPQQEGPAAFRQYEAKVYSQNGEDGLLLHLFATLGAPNRTFVEFGIGEGRECNTANLSLNFGWRGLLMECSAERAAKARAFYRHRLGGDADRVHIVETMVSPDNINELLRQHAPQGELDLLSIDIDGNDYWVWQAITSSPRVVVVEYNAVFGPTRAATVAFDPQFSRWDKHPSGLYFGASLAALARLGAAKGYRLAGCDRHGVNAFFVREDIAGDIPALSPEAAYYVLHDHQLGLIGEERFAEISALPFVDV